MRIVILAVAVALVLLMFGGCAMSRSHMETAHTNDDGTGHGDILTKSAFSTLGKQQVEQRTDFHVMPNNSGVDLVDGAISNQDATGMIPIIQSLIAAFTAQAQAQAAQQAVAPAKQGLTREDLLMLIDAIKR